MKPADPLTGRTIAIPETRELDVFASLLERRGAHTLRCPLVAIRDAPDPQPVLLWLRSFASGACDDLILLTGEGLRRLLACCEQHDPTLRAAVVSALAGVRTITRGPKPARALRELGLAPQIEASAPTTAGVIATLSALPLQGRRVGLQLYGGIPNSELSEFLQSAGAEVLPVAPYVYGDASSDAVVHEMLRAMRAGMVDAIAFTSKAQVERLFRLGPQELARDALASTQVAAVGPVVAEALRAHGVQVHAMPAASWFMKPLATELVALLGIAPPISGD
jgi:uroporphyrinogen-III synthase